MPVESGVRAAQHIHPAAPVEPDEIPMTPDAGIHVEIALAVALILRVVPEFHRHGRHRLGDDEFPHHIDDLAPLLVESEACTSQRTRLDLAGVYRQYRHPADESRAAVGAAASGSHP